MAIERMKLVRVMGMMDQLDTFIKTCCIDGIFQAEQAVESLPGTIDARSFDQENPYASMLQKMEELAGQCGVKLKKVSGVTKDLDQDAASFIQKLGEGIGKLYDDRKLLLSQLTTCENAIEQYQHFVGLGFRLEDIFGCQFIKVRFGHMPKESSEKLIAYKDNPFVEFVTCSQDETDNWGVYFAPSEQIEAVDEVFSNLYFERLWVPGAVGMPEEIIEQLRNNIAILNKETGETDQKLQEFWGGEETHCNEIYTQLFWLNSVLEMRRYAATPGDYFIYIGWVPEGSVPIFQQRADQIDRIDYELLEEREAEEVVKAPPPVKLKNKKVFRPFEYLVGMFGMPSDSDVDITAFVAITYTIMFGVMFADVGQGIVLSIVGFLMWKLRKMEIGKILIPCGFSACVVGFIEGSFFGYENLMDPLYLAVGLNGPPVRVMESITGLLLFSIATGVVLLVVTMLINMYGCIRHKRFGAALFSPNGLAGICLYLSGVCFVYNFMSRKIIVPYMVLGIVALISVVLLFFEKILVGVIDHEPDWKPESISDFILENLFELFEYVLSFFSNTISFLRIGAFVLVHSGMMIAVFAIAKLAPGPVGLIVVILGNIFVMCLEALFTSIQAMRLEFYELFSRCYVGEGRAFEPVVLTDDSNK